MKFKWLQTRMIALLACASVSSIASADWIYVSTNSMGEFFYDPQHTNRFGTKVETVMLTNLRKSELGTWSIISDLEYECEARTVTVMTIIRHSEANGKGKVLDFATYIDDAWPKNQKVPKESKMFSLVCGKYKSMTDNK